MVRVGRKLSHIKNYFSAARSHKLAPLIGSAALLSPLCNLSSSAVTTPLICLRPAWPLSHHALTTPSSSSSDTHTLSECCNGIPGSCKYFRELTPPNAGRNWGALPGQHSCLFTDITLWTELVHGYLDSAPKRIQTFSRFLLIIT